MEKQRTSEEVVTTQGGGRVRGDRGIYGLTHVNSARAAAYPRLNFRIERGPQLLSSDKDLAYWLGECFRNDKFLLYCRGGRDAQNAEFSDWTRCRDFQMAAYVCPSNLNRFLR